MALSPILSPMQTLFVQNYLVSLNAADAVRRAGYHTRNPAHHGKELMKNPRIKEAIDAALASRTRRLHVNQDYVVQKLISMVEANIGDYFEWDGTHVTFRGSESLSREQLALVKEISETDSGIKIVLPDKLAALEKLARHLGMFEKHRLSQREQDTLTRDVLKQVLDKELSPHDAALTLEAEGLPLPESIRCLLSRMPEQADDDQGDYSPISPEEMARRAEARLRDVEVQRTEFLPARQAEVVQLKEELGDRNTFRGQDAPHETNP